MEKGSETDIAKRNDVSASHVNIILEEISDNKLIKNYGKIYTYEYSNGVVEGTNNLIKQIKHTAC